MSGVAAALTMDVSRLRLAKGELQAVADAAALYATNGPGAMRRRWPRRGRRRRRGNACDGTVVVIAAANVVTGNGANRAFTPDGGRRPTPCA